MSLSDEDCNDKLDDLSKRQLEVLQEWEAKFQEKYKVVGKVAAFSCLNAVLLATSPSTCSGLKQAVRYISLLPLKPHCHFWLVPCDGECYLMPVSHVLANRLRMLMTAAAPCR